MKKMYTNKPLVESTQVPFEPVKWDHEHRRIAALEERVRQLSEQVHKLSSALQLNSRQIRRQNTDVHNITTVLRNR